MPRSTEETERIGVNAVEGIFLNNIGWAFREQRVSDYGIDAVVEIKDDQGKPTGRLLALQIKTGASYFRKSGAGYLFRGETRHLDYWSGHCLPVFLILHNPDDGMTLWQRIERRSVSETESGWSIVIPADNTLDVANKGFLALGISSDPSAMKRSRFAADQAEMERFANEEIYFRFDVWVNKTLKIRELMIYFDDPDKSQADEVIDIWAVGHDVWEVMNHFYPWLDYEVHEFTDAMEGSGEVESHVFSVRLNDAARAFLTLEAFYEDDSDPEIPKYPGEQDEEEC